jgi:hypothetical protein
MANAEKMATHLGIAMLDLSAGAAGIRWGSAIHHFWD